MIFGRNFRNQFAFIYVQPFDSINDVCYVNCYFLTLCYINCFSCMDTFIYLSGISFADKAAQRDRKESNARPSIFLKICFQWYMPNTCEN